MANYLKMHKRQQVIALLELGWAYRRIEAETGVRRETVSRYDRGDASKPAKVFPGSGTPVEPRAGGSPWGIARRPSMVTAGPGAPSAGASCQPFGRRFESRPGHRFVRKL